MTTERLLKRIALIEKGESEIKVQKEMLEDLLSGDSELINLKEKAEDAATRFSAHKKALLNEPEAISITNTLKEMQQDLKDNRDDLSGELLAYFRENDVLEFEDTNGDVYRISFAGKAKQKSTNN